MIQKTVLIGKRYIAGYVANMVTQQDYVDFIFDRNILKDLPANPSLFPLMPLLDPFYGLSIISKQLAPLLPPMMNSLMEQRIIQRS